MSETKGASMNTRTRGSRDVEVILHLESAKKLVAEIAMGRLHTSARLKLAANDAIDGICDAIARLRDEADTDWVARMVNETFCELYPDLGIGLAMGRLAHMLQDLRRLRASGEATEVATATREWPTPRECLLSLCAEFDRLLSLDHSEEREASKEYDEAWHGAVHALKHLRELADTITRIRASGEDDPICNVCHGHNALANGIWCHHSDCDRRPRRADVLRFVERAMTSARASGEESETPAHMTCFECEQPILVDSETWCDVRNGLATVCSRECWDRFVARFDDAWDVREAVACARFCESAHDKRWCDMTESVKDSWRWAEGTKHALLALMVSRVPRPIGTGAREAGEDE
jgi:hypothetical protein